MFGEPLGVLSDLFLTASPFTAFRENSASRTLCPEVRLAHARGEEVWWSTDTARLVSVGCGVGRLRSRWARLGQAEMGSVGVAEAMERATSARISYERMRAACSKMLETTITSSAWVSASSRSSPWRTVSGEPTIA